MYENKTPEKIKAAILADIGADGYLSTMAGSFADATVGPVSVEISEVYQSLNAVPSMLFVDETSGPFIDAAALHFWNLVRRSGTKAKGAINLTGDPGTVIAAGTSFLSAIGLEFQLLETVTLDASGTGVGQLEAAEVGSKYNLEAGALVRMYVNPIGLASYSSQETSGGTDRESDAALIARIDERRKRPITSGNGYHYRDWALSIPGIGNAKVVELASGPGTVGIMVIDSNYLPATAEKVTEVADSIRSKRPIGATVTVSTAAELNIDVTAQLTLSPGISLEDVRTEFLEKLEDYRRGIVKAKHDRVYYKPEEDVPYSVIYNRVLALLLTIQGVENFTLLTLNGGNEDITIQNDALPIISEVVIQE